MKISNNEKFSIDVDKMGIDWNQQRVKINNALPPKPKTINRHVKVAAAILTVLILTLSFIFFDSQKMDSLDIEYSYSFTEELDDYSMPESFYVLNNYQEYEDFEDDDQYLYYIIGENEEEL